MRCGSVMSRSRPLRSMWIPILSDAAGSRQSHTFRRNAWAVSARATPSRCIGLSLHPFARKWRRPASYWTRKAPCSRTRTIRTRSRCSIPRSRVRPIASSIGEALTGPAPTSCRPPRWVQDSDDIEASLLAATRSWLWARHNQIWAGDMRGPAHVDCRQRSAEVCAAGRGRGTKSASDQGRLWPAA